MAVLLLQILGLISQFTLTFILLYLKNKETKDLQLRLQISEETTKNLEYICYNLLIRK